MLHSLGATWDLVLGVIERVRLIDGSPGVKTVSLAYERGLRGEQRG